MPRMDIADLERFIDEVFPQSKAFGFTIAALTDDHITLALEADETHLRPGGTISGPVLMALADTAAYLIILANLGPVALAVTTNLNIHFMRKPGPGALWSTARLLKLGKRIAVTEVRLHGAHEDEHNPYAHATVTYSIPPPRASG